MERITYTSAVDYFTTPRGHTARMHYRLDTNDWNTLYATMNADDYRLAILPELTGLALDIGAYIGSVAIALALDHPELKVVCVEPIRENVLLIQQNVRENGLEDRITVLQAGAASPGVDTTTVRWRFRGSPVADHHAFVGNTTLTEAAVAPVECEEQVVGCVSLSGIIDCYGPVRLLKIDCEGCEWSFLSDPAVSQVPLMLGEWHGTNGHVRNDIQALLEATHDLEFTGPEGGPAEFRAMLRAA